MSNDNLYIEKHKKYLEECLEKARTAIAEGNYDEAEQILSEVNQPNLAVKLLLCEVKCLITQLEDGSDEQRSVKLFTESVISEESRVKSNDVCVEDNHSISSDSNGKEDNGYSTGMADNQDIKDDVIKGISVGDDFKININENYDSESRDVTYKETELVMQDEGIDMLINNFERDHTDSDANANTIENENETYISCSFYNNNNLFKTRERDDVETEIPFIYNFKGKGNNTVPIVRDEKSDSKDEPNADIEIKLKTVLEKYISSENSATSDEIIQLGNEAQIECCSGGGNNEDCLMLDETLSEEDPVKNIISTNPVYKQDTLQKNTKYCIGTTPNSICVPESLVKEHGDAEDSFEDGNLDEVESFSRKSQYVYSKERGKKMIYKVQTAVENKQATEEPGTNKIDNYLPTIQNETSNLEHTEVTEYSKENINEDCNEVMDTENLSCKILNTEVSENPSIGSRLENVESQQLIVKADDSDNDKLCKNDRNFENTSLAYDEEKFQETIDDDVVPTSQSTYVLDKLMTADNHEVTKCLNIAQQAFTDGNLVKAEKFFKKAQRLHLSEYAQNMLHEIQIAKKSAQVTQEVERVDIDNCLSTGIPTTPNEISNLAHREEIESKNDCVEANNYLIKCNEKNKETNMYSNAIVKSYSRNNKLIQDSMPLETQVGVRDIPSIEDFESNITETHSLSKEIIDLASFKAGQVVQEAVSTEIANDISSDIEPIPNNISNVVNKEEAKYSNVNIKEANNELIQAKNLLFDTESSVITENLTIASCTKEDAKEQQRTVKTVDDEKLSETDLVENIMNNSPICEEGKFTKYTRNDIASEIIYVSAKMVKEDNCDVSVYIDNSQKACTNRNLEKSETLLDNEHPSSLYEVETYVKPEQMMQGVEKIVDDDISLSLPTAQNEILNLADIDEIEDQLGSVSLVDGEKMSDVAPANNIINPSTTYEEEKLQKNTEDNISSTSQADNVTDNSVRNQQDALKCMNIAQKAFTGGDLERAEKFLNRSQRIHPSEQAQTMLHEVQTAIKAKQENHTTQASLEKETNESLGNVAKKSSKDKEASDSLINSEHKKSKSSYLRRLRSFISKPKLSTEK